MNNRNNSTRDVDILRLRFQSNERAVISYSSRSKTYRAVALTYLLLQYTIYIFNVKERLTKSSMSIPERPLENPKGV